ncbi:MAG: pitrilysin family protein [Proteobacteria bacterium]|nr:pitrilysin family protein [Pseudomonadota bacterium]
MKFILLLIGLMATFFTQAKIDVDFWTTDNGVRVYFVESHELPIVDININFDAGAARDPVGKSGLANLTNYLMLLGAGQYSENQISNLFSDIGSTLGGGIDHDHAKLNIRTLSKKEALNQTIETFKLVISEPSFEQKIFEREKKNTLSFLEQSNTQPDSLGTNAFIKALFGNHPYAFPQQGTVETIQKLERKDLVDFYNNYYSAQNASIVIVGDVNKTEVKKIVAQLTQDLPKKNHPSIPIVDDTKAQEIMITNPAQQAHLFYGMPSMVRLDKDFYPLYVGNYILGGGGFVSRLTSEVREKNGLVYSVYSYFMPMHQKGPFQISLQTKKEQIDDAFKLVKKVVLDFIENGPTEKELNDAKLNLIGGFPLRLDSNKKISEYLSMMAIYNYPIDYLETFTKNINNVTINEVKDAFQRRMDMSKFSTVIVGKN